MPLIVPPGGFAGFSQMTSSSRHALSSPMERAAVRSSRRQGVKVGTRRKKRKSTGKRASARTGGRKPKFGSPAWHKKYKTGKFKK